MKHLYTLIILLTVVSSAVARERYDMNRNWKFFPNTETSSDNAQIVNLPHTWNTDALGGRSDYFRGTGNYEKEIDIPASWRGKRIFFRSGGANTIAQVFVNGKFAGEHLGGYSPFCFEITDLVNIGRGNVILVVVSNAPYRDVLPTAGDATFYGGMVREAELIVTGKEIVYPAFYATDGILIAQKNITRDRAEAEVTVKVGGTADANVQLQVTVYDDSLRSVASSNMKLRLNGSTVSTVKVPVTVDNPRLWNAGHDPYLYTVVAKVVSGNIVTDSVAVTTGFRSLAMDPDRGFLLNGEPFPIRGVTLHQDRAMYGPAIDSRHVAQDIETAMEMGVNMIRLEGVQHHPALYRLCDELGILVWSDFPLVGGVFLTDMPFLNTHSYRENGLEQVTEQIFQHFNHPSVIMWGLFSNIRLRGDDPTDFISQLELLTKREDRSRLTVAMSNEDGELNFIPDMIVWNHSHGWTEGRPSDIEIWIGQYKFKWAHLPAAVSYAAGASVNHQGPATDRPDHTGPWHPEGWQTRFHETYFRALDQDDFFWGIFAGNLFDYGAAERSWGEGNGLNDCGLVTFDRSERKDAFYLYKAKWNREDKFVHLVEKRWDKRKDNKQTFKVYSNHKIVELIVNGESHGLVEGTDGIFRWNGVELKEGENFIRVVAGKNSDSAIITVDPHTGYFD